MPPVAILRWRNHMRVPAHFHFPVFQSYCNVFIYIHKEDTSMFYLIWRKDSDHSPRDFSDRNLVSGDSNSIWKPPILRLLNRSFSFKAGQSEVTCSNPSTLQAEKLRVRSLLPQTWKDTHSFLVSQLESSFQGKSLPAVEIWDSKKKKLKFRSHLIKNDQIFSRHFAMFHDDAPWARKTLQVYTEWPALSGKQPWSRGTLPNFCLF